MVDETTPNRTTPTSARATIVESVSARSIRPNPRANGGSRPRTPASASAVRDGRTLLAQFRNNKRRDEPSPHDAMTVPPHASGSSGPSAVKSAAGKSTIDYVARYASRAPGIARNLEAALDASLANRRNSDDTDGGGVVGGEGKGAESCSTPTQGTLHPTTLNGGPNGDTVGPSGDVDEICREHGDESSDGAASPATAADPTTAAATAATATVAAAVAATKPSPPRKDGIGSSGESPARPTPEHAPFSKQVLRQEARTSQAAFLFSVLPESDLDLDASPSTSTRLQMSPAITPNGRWGTATDGGTGAAIAWGGAEGLDRRAVARWASMRRLQEQSVGLGSAADHQLTRALQLCRDLRGLKNGIGGGNLSGNERASRLDALQSTLHGLQEVLAKRNEVEKAAGVEAEALGGPAVLTSLLQGDSDQIQVDAVGEGDGGAATATKTPTTETAVADAGGWCTGLQLKAFEKQVQARSSIEISALESERRKLRSKVEMFQRQVQLLQREGATQSPAVANGSSSKIGSSPMRQGDVNGFGSAAGEKRFADLLDARLGEERHVQATLEAELNSLRGNLEEKDGLISALREALRSAATPKANRDTTTVDDGRSRTSTDSKQPTSPADQQDVVVVENTPAPRSADGRAVVPGRGVFAPLSNESNRSQGRYHSRSSRLMGAQGPVATAEAAARRASGPPREGPWSGSSSAGGGGRTHGDELRMAEGGRWGVPNGDRAASEALASSSTGEDVTTPRRRGSSDGVVADSAVAFPSRNGTPAAGVAAAKRSTSAASSARVSPSGVSRRREGDGYTDIISQATAVTGTALRSLWESARVMGSRVGLDGAAGSESPRNKPLRRGNSSHAVLIL